MNGDRGNDDNMVMIIVGMVVMMLTMMVQITMKCSIACACMFCSTVPTYPMVYVHILPANMQMLISIKTTSSMHASWFTTHHSNCACQPALQHERVN